MFVAYSPKNDILRKKDVVFYYRKFVDFLAKISEEKGIVFSVTDAKRLKDTGFAIQDATVNGYFTEDGIAINISSSKALNTIVGHELTHALAGSRLYDALKDVVVEYAKTTGDYNSHIAALKQIYSGKKGYETDLDAKAERELVADLCGDYLFSDTDFISRISVKNRNLFQKIYDEIKYLAKLATSGSKEARQLEKVKHLFEQVYRDTKNTAQQTDGVKYSFKGYADDGKGIYESNFPIGTPKKAKGERILKYIQDVWSKKPITLRIEENGNVRYIEAKFDPTYSEDKNIRTDASKLMGGNRHGTSAEQRVTLDLADDYYQIAGESKYSGSKDETGKQSETHKGVKQWHYFVNDIYFSEYESTKLIPYTVSINVKEKANGNYFYSFSAEKSEGISTQRTLHAAVNGSEDATANGDSSNVILSENNQIVNAKLSLSENLEGNVPAGDQTYGQDVEIDLYDDSNVDQDAEIDLQDDPDADDNLETDVQGIDAEIEQHLATSLETSRKMDAAAEAGDMEQYRTYKAMYNSLEERIRFLYQQKADANAKLGKAFTNAPAEAAQPVRSVAPTREDIARQEYNKKEQNPPQRGSHRKTALLPRSKVLLLKTI